PDGAVWVLDWYNFIIQHNPTPSAERGGFDAENGAGNAYENPLRDKSHGRIWRVVYKGAEEYEPLSLNKDEPEALIEALEHDNLFWRQTAQRLLVERAEKDVLPDLKKLVNNAKTNAEGNNFAALHALWTFHGLGGLESDEDARQLLQGALGHSASEVRKAAIQLLPHAPWAEQAMARSGVVNDEDPNVRLAAVLYLAEAAPSESVGKTLYKLSQEEETGNDTWMAKAVYAAAKNHSSRFLAAFKADNPGYDPSTEVISREDFDLDEAKWKTMELPQFFEAAGLEMD